MNNNWNQNSKDKNSNVLFRFFISFYTNFTQSSNFRSLTYVVLTIVLLFNYLYFSVYKASLPINTNRINLTGEPLSEDRKISVTHFSPLPTSFASLLQERINKVDEQKDLLNFPYVPSAVVFNGVDEKSPWISLEKATIEGKLVGVVSPSEIAFESRSILNPFLLIDPFFIDLSALEGTSLVNNQTPFSADIQPKIQEIIFSKNRDEHKTIILISKYYEEAIENKRIIGKPTNLVFNIAAYNARDLGFNTIQFLPEESKNVTANPEAIKPNRILQSIAYQSTICSETQGCNHRQGDSAAFQNFSVSQIPATVTFELSRRNEENIFFKMRSVIELQ